MAWFRPVLLTVAFLVASVLDVCIMPNCSAQESNSAAVSQARIEPASFTGCYELLLGKWWPWDFGGDTVFVTPPTRIELLPEHGTVGFETNGFKIRTISPQNNVPPGRPMSSFWEIKSRTKVHLTWTNGLSGVTLDLKKHGTELRGRAHPHFDFPTFVPRTQHVTAKRINCGHPALNPSSPG